MPARPRAPRASLRPAILVVGGALLLVGLLVSQAFLPVSSPGLRRPPATTPTPSAPRILKAVTPQVPVNLPAHSFAPAAPPAVPASEPFAAVMDLATPGHFPAAAALALALPENQLPAALASLFSLWAKHAPYEAAAAALALPLGTPAARDHAWQAVVATWSAAVPAELAAYSLTLPESAAAPRRYALAAAIRHWLAHDAPAAMDWVGRLPSGPETDGAVALVAQHPDVLALQPDLALDWAESIQDPALRSRTLGRVVRAWRESSPAARAAAEHYARTSPDLLPSEREDILVGERFTAHP